MSSGFFLLPGLAFAEAGPAVVVAFLLAGLPLIPGTLAQAELATAMPRAGGIYFFVDRTMGPLPGTVAGFGTWLGLVLKTAFALVGMGAYLGLLVPGLPLPAVAATAAVLLGVVNWLGSGKGAWLQVALVAVVLLAAAAFVGAGAFSVVPARFDGFFAAGWEGVAATAAMTCVAYGGLTKVAGVGEEIDRPERNVPLGLMLSLAVAMLAFAGGSFVMVGVLDADRLAASLTPASDAGTAVFGPWGGRILAAAAILAFVAVANAGIMSGSRYPLAMARDHLLPRAFRYVGRHGTPSVGIVLTVVVIVACVALLDPTGIAKLASAFQLLLFAASCAGVLVMRESRIAAYDPGYRSPLYPWMHLAGIAAPLWLITRMGALTVLFCAGLVGLGVVWYFQYARHRVTRAGAVHHVFERWGRRRYDGIDAELREIMKERGPRAGDPFDALVAGAEVLDLGRFPSLREVVEEASRALARRTGLAADELAAEFLEGTRVGATPVAHGVALPHLRSARVERPVLALVRTAAGLHGEDGGAWGEHAPGEPVYGLFFLVSPEAAPAQHLRILAHIAGRVDDEDFLGQWLAAADRQQLKEILLRDERYLHLDVQPALRSAPLLGAPLRELRLPRTCLVAIVHRGGESFVPDGDTVLAAGDRITVIGEPEGIRLLASRYNEQDALFPVPDAPE